MEKDAFQAMWQMLKPSDQADGLQLCEGRVESVSPLRVTAFGLLFSGNGVLVNAQLMTGWSQGVSLQHQTGTWSGTETVTSSGLRIGDRVLCLADGGRALYILMKVVSA